MGIKQAAEGWWKTCKDPRIQKFGETIEEHVMQKIVLVSPGHSTRT